MYVLGIETSCDETSVSVVKDGKKVLSNCVASSLTMHKKYGGVIPEIAFRVQLETIAQVAEAALRDAGIKKNKIDLVSVTKEPGLLGSLLVGLCFARGLSYGLKIPLLEVNHLYAHIYANFLNRPEARLPAVALIVSGGHSSLFYVRDFNRIEPLGATQDDAVGEAFDKVAKILNLGYPGGPIIEQLARKGDPRRIKFNCSDTKLPLNFSFSGIKTAVLYYAQSHKPLSAGHKADIAASFQKSVIEVLIRKALLACKRMKVKRLLVGGGVAANNKLREEFIEAAAHAGAEVHFPDRAHCMDNAAMVAGLGFKLGITKEGA